MSSKNGRQATPGTYRSLAGFYRADSRRINSRELDVGLWWRESIDGPLHRAAWVSDTGELYLARLGPSVEGEPGVELLAVVDDRERLESALAGWRERCGQPRSLSWLRERSARLGQREHVQRPRILSRAPLEQSRRPAPAPVGAGIS
jgi:hypothetical protein